VVLLSVESLPEQIHRKDRGLCSHLPCWCFLVALAHGAGESSVHQMESYCCGVSHPRGDTEPIKASCKGFSFAYFVIPATAVCNKYTMSCPLYWDRNFYWDRPDISAYKLFGTAVNVQV
jgi:hypothetical protein